MTYEELDAMLAMHCGAKPWISACEFLYAESERQDKLREELSRELAEANKKLKSRQKPVKTDSQQKEIDRLKHIIKRREEQFEDAIRERTKAEEEAAGWKREHTELGKRLREAIGMHETIQSKIQEAIKDTLGIDIRKQPLIQNVKHLCNRLKQAEATLPTESELQKEVRALRAVTDTSDNAKSIKEQLHRIDDICEKHGFSIDFDKYDRQVQAIVDAFLAQKSRADSLAAKLKE